MLDPHNILHLPHRRQIQWTRPKLTKQQLIAILSISALLLLSILMRLIYIHYIPLSYDEGHWLMFGTLAAQGHTPYTETFVGIPPLALLTIQAGVTLFGSTIYARYPMMLYSLIGVISFYWLVKQQAPRRPLLTGLLAAAILSLGPRYLPLSGTIMAEVPAIALALLSLVFVQLYRRRPAPYWLILSGVAFALSLALKIFVIFLPLLIGLQLLLIIIEDKKAGDGGEASAGPPPKGSTPYTLDVTTGSITKLLHQPATYLKLVRLGLVWLAGLLLTLSLFAILYEPAAMFREVVLFRTELRQATLAAGHWVDDTTQVMQEEGARYVPLIAGTGFNLWIERRQGLIKRSWLWLLWLVMAVIFLPWHVPLRARHSVLLLVPLAAFTSHALIYLLDNLPHRLKRYFYLVNGSLHLALLWYLLFTPGETLAALQTIDFNADQVENVAAATFVRRNSAPSDCLVVDDQRFAFQAGRLVPPFLSETSEARLAVGWLDAAQIIETAGRYNCMALAIQSERFDIYLPDLRDAAASIYSLDMDFRNPETGKETTLYAVQINNTQPPSRPINRSFGGLVSLKGVDLAPMPWSVDQPIPFSTYWLTEKMMDHDYKFFLHLKDAQGNVVATFDHYPFELDPDYLAPDVAISPRYLNLQDVAVFEKYPTTGLIPTRFWIPGNTLKETITLTLPKTLLPGTYSFTLGLYDETTQQRLALSNDASGENAVRLEQITIGH